ncbi:unnamed protein product [Discosporangium mesarthrocarpum]
MGTALELRGPDLFFLFGHGTRYCKKKKLRPVPECVYYCSDTCVDNCSETCVDNCSRMHTLECYARPGCQTVLGRCRRKCSRPWFFSETSNAQCVDGHGKRQLWLTLSPLRSSVRVHTRTWGVCCGCF